MSDQVSLQVGAKDLRSSASSACSVAPSYYNLDGRVTVAFWRLFLAAGGGYYGLRDFPNPRDRLSGKGELVQQRGACPSCALGPISSEANSGVSSTGSGSAAGLGVQSSLFQDSAEEAGGIVRLSLPHVTPFVSYRSILYSKNVQELLLGVDVSTAVRRGAAR